MNDTVVRLPSVQLIGAQKAGTSAIADWLFEKGGFNRPQVFENEPCYYSKEVHFFDIDSRFHRGLDFYAERFQDADSISTTTMDATPDTLAFPERVQSAYQSAGGDQVNSVKIIAILREPVARELSLYNHLAFDCRNLPASDRTNWHNQVLKSDGTIMTFCEFVRNISMPALGKRDSEDNGSGRSSRHGLYFDHLQKWFELFNRNQILVLSYDELSKDPRRLEERIQHFLDRTIKGNLRRSNSNDSRYKVALPSKEAKQRLLSIFDPQNEKLYRLLKDHPGPAMEQRPFPRFTTH